MQIDANDAIGIGFWAVLTHTLEMTAMFKMFAYVAIVILYLSILQQKYHAIQGHLMAAPHRSENVVAQAPGPPQTRYRYQSPAVKNEDVLNAAFLIWSPAHHFSLSPSLRSRVTLHVGATSSH